MKKCNGSVGPLGVSLWDGTCGDITLSQCRPFLPFLAAAKDSWRERPRGYRARWWWEFHCFTTRLVSSAVWIGRAICGVGAAVSPSGTRSEDCRPSPLMRFPAHVDWFMDACLVVPNPRSEKSLVGCDGRDTCGIAFLPGGGGMILSTFPLTLPSLR